MKRRNLLSFLVLSFALLIGIANNGYSQWTLAGQVPVGTGTAYPSISVVDANIVWEADGVNTPIINRTTNGGLNWTSVPTTGISMDVFCVWGIDANTAYVGNGGAAGGSGGNATFYKTTDGGTTWTPVGSTGGTAGFFNGIVFSKTVPSFGIAESDPPTGSGQAYYVSKTTDGGLTWTATSPPGFSGAASAQNSIVVIDPMFYAWGNNVAASMIVTTDGGVTFNNRTAAGLTGTFTSGLAFKDDKLTGLIATSTSLPSVGRTTNGGVSWTPVNTGAGLTGYCTIKWIEGTNTCYISGNAGASGVIRKSTDGGLTWTTMTTSSLTGVTHMEFKRSGTSVYGYAVTANGAILKITETVTLVNQINSSVPDGYSLNQNYPNPFNPATKINFSIPRSSKVNLKIYDALGKEIETLVNENLQAGNYSVDFKAGADLTSGVYYYKIIADNFVSTRKMMLVK